MVYGNPAKYRLVLVILSGQSFQGIAKSRGALVAILRIPSDGLDQELGHILIQIGSKSSGILTGAVHVTHQRLQGFETFPTVAGS